MDTGSLRARSEHFDFGENWASYSKLIDDGRIQTAIESVRSLTGDLAGKSFLDIGCGSGLFSLAALRLGAASVKAIDIDENSVATARAVLTREPGDWTVKQTSVFDLPPEQFDVVYSWGVLHHTGDMREAIRKAGSLVAPGGIFAFSLYEKTPLCPAWRVEKRLYRKAPKAIQWIIRAAYLSAYRTGLVLTRRRPRERRGMEMAHNIHDWLGGYPYESTTLSEIEPLLAGFTLQQHKPAPVHAKGLLGSGCSEYVFIRH